jgi:hypothetical protein
MSGSIDYSLLFGAGTGGGIADPLLSILAGGNTTSAGADALAALNHAETFETRDVANVAKQPQVSRAVAAFTAAVAAAKTPADLLKNPQALNVLLTANGLGDQSSYTALAQKALLSDTTDSKSLVNQLADTRWKTVAATYDFANKGLSLLNTPAALATLANQYAEVQWRTSLDASTPGLSSALDFRARAATITSVDQILGDSTFRNVILGAFNIPPQIAYQDLTAQEQAVATRVDLTKFKTPQYVESITQRYLQSQQTAAGSSLGSLDSLAVQAQGLLV